MIKQMYLWNYNADDEIVLFGIVIVTLICSVLIGLFTYWGLAIFGPWAKGMPQILYFTWAGVVGFQFYFWSRWARYSSLRRQGRMDNRTGKITRKWFNFKSNAEKKREAEERKLQERRIALGFADEVRR